jgi:hypothetical protein
VVSQHTILSIDDLVFTHGLPDNDLNFIHGVIIGPPKEEKYPVHLTLKDGTFSEIRIHSKYLLLSNSDCNKRPKSTT